MPNISTIKPEIDETRRRPKPDITWNHREEQSLKDNGFWPQEGKEDNYFEEPPRINYQEKFFLSQVDIRQGPILRQVTKIVRIKARDWSTEKREREEYLYYYENWYGKNHLGLKITPVTDHVEGVFMEATKELAFNPNSGEELYYKKGRSHETYYIPFTKKKLDEIMAGEFSKNKSVKYIHNPEDIKFVVKFASEDSPPGLGRSASRGEFSYEQIATWTFADLYKLHVKPWNNQDPNYAPTTKIYK